MGKLGALYLATLLVFAAVVATPLGAGVAAAGNAAGNTADRPLDSDRYWQGQTLSAAGNTAIAGETWDIHAVDRDSSGDRLVGGRVQSVTFDAAGNTTIPTDQQEGEYTLRAPNGNVSIWQDGRLVRTVDPAAGEDSSISAQTTWTVIRQRLSIGGPAETEVRNGGNDRYYRTAVTSNRNEFVAWVSTSATVAREKQRVSGSQFLTFPYSTPPGDITLTVNVTDTTATATGPVTLSRTAGEIYNVTAPYPGGVETVIEEGGVYPGRRILVATDLDPNTTYELYEVETSNTGEDIITGSGFVSEATTNETGAAWIDTENLRANYSLATPSRHRLLNFSVVEQTLSMSSSAETLPSDGTANLTISSNRDQGDVVLWLEGQNRSVVTSTFPDVTVRSGDPMLSLSNGTARTQVDASGLPGGEYTVNAEAAYAGARTSATIAVESETTAFVSYTEDGGSTSSTTVTVTATPTATPTPSETTDSETATTTAVETESTTSTGTADSASTTASSTTTEGDETPVEGPGFGMVATLLALLLLAWRRQ
jgi:hypothetical protein